ncbi:hypothetical protein HK405_007353, partial [Cladochytrium tenue]
SLLRGSWIPTALYVKVQVNYRRCKYNCDTALAALGLHMTFCQVLQPSDAFLENASDLAAVDGCLGINLTKDALTGCIIYTAEAKRSNDHAHISFDRISVLTEGHELFSGTPAGTGLDGAFVLAIKAVGKRWEVDDSSSVISVVHGETKILAVVVKNYSDVSGNEFVIMGPAEWVEFDRVVVEWKDSVYVFLPIPAGPPLSTAWTAIAGEHIADYLSSVASYILPSAFEVFATSAAIVPEASVASAAVVDSRFRSSVHVHVVVSLRKQLLKSRKLPVNKVLLGEVGDVRRSRKQRKYAVVELTRESRGDQDPGVDVH